MRGPAGDRLDHLMPVYKWLGADHPPDFLRRMFAVVHSPLARAMMLRAVSSGTDRRAALADRVPKDPALTFARISELFMQCLSSAVGFVRLRSCAPRPCA